MSIRQRAATLAQEIGNHKGMRGRIGIGENILWMTMMIEDSIDAAVAAERERCAKIAEDYFSPFSHVNKGIAEQIRAGKIGD